VATDTWIGGLGTNDLNDASQGVNWSTGSPPTTGDTVVVGSNATLDINGATFSSNDILPGTGDTLNLTNVIIDNASTIDTKNVNGGVTINAIGATSQKGFILADGAAGSVLTIALGAASSTPANYQLQSAIIAKAGNTVVLTSAANTNRIDNDGALVAAGGTIDIAARFNNSTGQLLIFGGGTAIIDSTKQPGGQHVVFTDTTGTLLINSGNLAGFSSHINGFTAGDTITLAGVTGTVTTSYSSGVLSIIQNSSTIGTLHFQGGTYNNASFSLVTTGSGTTITTTNAVTSWAGTAGDWGTASAWVGNSVPGSGQAVTLGITDLSQVGQEAITVSQAEQAASLLLDEPQSSFTVTAGLTITHGFIDVGGSIVATGAAAQITASNFDQTSDTLALSAGASLTLTGASSADFGTSAAQFDGGTTIDNATLNAGAGYLLVGVDTGPSAFTGNSASLTAENGATVTAGYTGLGIVGGDATLTVTGAGTTWRDIGTANDSALTQFSGGMLVAGGDIGSNGTPSPGGTSSLTLSAGATLTETTGAWIGVGAANGLTSNGSVTVDNATWRIGTELDVGGAEIYAGTLTGGVGQLTVQNGGAVKLGAAASATTATVTVGNVANSQGTLAVTGAGSTLDAGGGLIEVGGNNALGTLTVGSQARVSAANLALRLGSRVSVDGTGTLELGSAGGATAGALNIDSGATLSGAGEVAAAVVDNGLLIANQGGSNTLTVDFAISGTGTLALVAGATLNLATTAAISTNIDFGTDSGGTVETVALADPGVFSGTLENFYGLDTVHLMGIAASAPLSFDSASGVLTINNSVSLHIGGAHPQSFTLIADGTNSYLSAVDLACFAGGTRIATPEGEVPVEQLRPGDAVSLARGGWSRVAWVGWRRVSADDASAQPVRIAAHTFGPNRPCRDLWLSPEHAVSIGAHLVVAGSLVGAPGITRAQRRSLTYFHILLRQHDIILAENLPCETLCDTVDSVTFDNGHTVPPSLAFLDPCAPRISQGAALEAVRAGLMGRQAVAAL
jgi:hypothetical protein